MAKDEVQSVAENKGQSMAEDKEQSMAEDKCQSDKKTKLRRCTLYGAGGLIIVALVIFLFWAITRPTKPSFTLQDATVYSFNRSSLISQPNVLSASLQITISSRNQMGKIGIYYEKLDVYASYRNQQITLPTLLPETYLGHKENVVWTLFLNANPVDVPPYVAEALAQDLSVGTIPLNVRVEGIVKWKVGLFVSGKYQLNANCQAFIAIGAAMKLEDEHRCFVDV